MLLAEVNPRRCLEESEQWLENVDRTHLVLACGNLALQKKYINTQHSVFTQDISAKMCHLAVPLGERNLCFLSYNDKGRFCAAVYGCVISRNLCRRVPETMGLCRNCAIQMRFFCE